MVESVSVAIASYNGARYIRQQLDSIAAQDRPPDELVVADDGSRDDTVAIVEAFGREVHFPVKVVRHSSNIGILENFYSAFAACSGSILVYCDQDDVWLPRKISTLLDALGGTAVLAMHQSEVVDGELNPLGRIVPGNHAYGRMAFPVDTRAVHGHGHQMAFRREVLDLMVRLRSVAGGVPAADFMTSFDEFIPFCASLLGDLVALPDPLVRFRRHEAAVSQAGSAAGAAMSLRDRTLDATRRDRDMTRVRIEVIERAIAAGLLPDARSGRLIDAYRRKLAVAEAQQAMLTAPGRIGSMLGLPVALMRAAKGTGFSNEHRKRTLGLSLVAGLARR